MCAWLVCFVFNPLISSCGGGTEPPAACPMGYFCPYGDKQPCPAGHYSGSRTGLRTVDECVLCPAGFYCPEATATPIPSSPVFFMLTTYRATTFRGWECRQIPVWSNVQLLTHAPKAASRPTEAHHASSAFTVPQALQIRMTILAQQALSPTVITL